MKRILLLLTLFSSFSISNGQQFPVLQEKCATMHSLNHRLQQNSNLAFRHAETEQRAAEWLKTNSPSTLRNGILTIPVVVHVVYNQTDSLAQNVPDSVIQSQIDVLNEDFGRYNADAVNTPAIFDSIAANMGIQFCLASVDPMGNPTNGITRTGTSASFFTTPFTNSVKRSADGGVDPWPTDQYLNIWLCDMSFLGSPFVLGYAQFPGDDPLTDGVVIQYQYFGRYGNTTTAPSNLGRTTTHEVGHWLGLRHVWGDGDCTMDDFVWDTPNADAQSNFDCQETRNTCDDAGNPFWNGANPPDMVQNFMDYSADDCMNMFSHGQMDRVWSFLSTSSDRLGLFSSDGCGTPEVNAIATISDPSCLDSCDAQAVVTPVAGSAPFTFLWNDPANTTDSIAINLCSGNYICRVADANQDTIYVSVVVSDPLFLTATIDSVSATCSTCADGSITISVVGGNPPYEFSLNGGTPQTDSVFNGLNPGQYTITVADACKEITQTVDVGNSVGIGAQEISERIRIYPNPALDILYVQSDHLNANLEILSITGQLLFSQKVTHGVQSISLEGLSSGMYFVRFTVNENSGTFRLIKE